MTHTDLTHGDLMAATRGGRVLWAWATRVGDRDARRPDRLSSQDPPLRGPSSPAPKSKGVATPLYGGRDSIIRGSQLPYDPKMVKFLSNEVVIVTHGDLIDSLLKTLLFGVRAHIQGGCDPLIRGLQIS